VRAQGRPDERLPGGVVVEFKLDSAVQGGLWLEDESVGELVLDEEVVVVGVGGVEWLVPGEVDAGGGDRRGGEVEGRVCGRGEFGADWVGDRAVDGVWLAVVDVVGC